MTALALIPAPFTGQVDLTPKESLARTLRRAKWLLAATCLGLGVPLALVPIRGAVIAPGEVTVSTQVKKIAHPHGGVIAELKVSNGARVTAGQVLVRLDTNVSSASAAMTAESIDQLLGKFWSSRGKAKAHI